MRGSRRRCGPSRRSAGPRRAIARSAMRVPSGALSCSEYSARPPGGVDVRQPLLNGAPADRPQALRLLARQFASPLVLILLAGAAVSAVLRDWLDASIILAIVLGSAALGFWQEYRASAAVARLRARLALTAQVLREGKRSTVPASEIVPGDTVLLAAGNLIPADGKLLEARDFLVSEAALTGESLP